MRAQQTNSRREGFALDCSQLSEYQNDFQRQSSDGGVRAGITGRTIASSAAGDEKNEDEKGRMGKYLSDAVDEGVVT
jgi:hypothetical protein